MANATDICRVLSDRLGIRLSEVRQISHRLRVAGLLPEGGRGLYAPQLSSRDAAAILIAVLGRLEFPAMKAATAFDRIAHLPNPWAIIVEPGGGDDFLVALPGTYWDTLTLILERSRDEKIEDLNRLVIGEIGVSVFGNEIIHAWLCIHGCFFPRAQQTYADPFTSMIANHLNQTPGEESAGDEKHLPAQRVNYFLNFPEGLFEYPRKENAVQYSRIIPALGEALGPVEPGSTFEIALVAEKCGIALPDIFEVNEGTQQTETDTARGANHEPVISEARSPKTNQGSGGPATTTANGSVAQAKNESQ